MALVRSPQWNHIHAGAHIPPPHRTEDTASGCHSLCPAFFCHIPCFLRPFGLRVFAVIVFPPNTHQLKLWCWWGINLRHAQARCHPSLASDDCSYTHFQFFADFAGGLDWGPGGTCRGPSPLHCVSASAGPLKERFASSSISAPSARSSSCRGGTPPTPAPRTSGSACKRLLSPRRMPESAPGRFCHNARSIPKK